MAKLYYLRSFLILAILSMVLLISIYWVHAEESEWIPVTGQSAERTMEVPTARDKPVLSAGFGPSSQSADASSAPDLAILFSPPTEMVPAPVQPVQSITLPQNLPQPVTEVAVWFGASLLVVVVSAVSIFWVRRTSL